MTIKGYHIHIYCQPHEIPLCQEIRTLMLQNLKEIQGAGPVRSLPIGPHPLPMFEAWFEPEFLHIVLQWTMENRRGLSVLLHPLTGNDYLDHAEHALWLGEKLPLKLEIFERP